MKRKFTKYLFIAMSLFIVGATSACASKSFLTPEDAIKDAYGDKQFRISFDSTNLNSPIADMYYTANNMPSLPIPTKVGYVFEGWYFDNTFTDRCDVENGDLFWKMSDVTLYAKWNVEQIVNNGQYDIEFEAHIVESTINKGPKARENFYRFDEDIIEENTYIEKNDFGTYLRIQYDSRTRGPVLGGEDVNADNFSQQTYTITDDENRISEELSIFDRTSTLQTLYYDIEGLNLADTITLFVEYYNWIDEMPEKDRRSAKVTYNVEFNITRFIGFKAPFVNPNSRLEDGIYTVPTHYTDLGKNPSILDMFNPVTSYIKAYHGTYKLYKPMSAYNNDFTNVTPELMPLRTTGFSKEFTAFLIDQDRKLTKEEEDNAEGKYFIPGLLRADKFIPLSFEFNGQTGEYYYVLDLGKTLDKDVVFFGGSSGAMEQMFNFPSTYRRLVINYNSMTRLASFAYKEPVGDRYEFSRNVSFYPGSLLDFKETNTDFDHFKENLSSITYPNCFYTKDSHGEIKVYDSRISITPFANQSLNYNATRHFFNFNMHFEVFGYDPLLDGTLYSRDVKFVNNTYYHYSNSTVEENYNGKSLNIGDAVSINDLITDKVTKKTAYYTYQAYEVDDSLNINYKKPVDVERKFTFKQNLAIKIDLDFKTYKTSALIYLMEEKAPIINVYEKGWEKNSSGIYTTNQRFNIGDDVTLPNFQYEYFNKKFYTRSLFKYDDEPETKYTDYTKVGYYTFSQGIYTAHSYFPASDVDITMDQERIRALVQLENQFKEFVPIIVEFKGVTSGEFKIKENDKVILNGDLKYEGNVRNAINYKYLNTIDIANETDINKIPNELTLEIKDYGETTFSAIPFKFAIIYLKEETINVNDKSLIYEKIKDQPYAVIYSYFINDYGDQILYKAQFNFLIEGDGVSEFNIIKSNRTIFTHQEVTLVHPFVTNSNHKKVGNVSLEVRKKISNHYIADCFDSVHHYRTNEYESRLEFIQPGKYLLTYVIDLIRNDVGGILFDRVDPSNKDTYISLEVSEEINVYDRKTNVTMTFVTDNAHPFKIDSKELFGYKISSDDKYQYATKAFSADDKIKSLSQEAFDVPYNKAKLYRWIDNGNNLIALPGNYMRNVNVNMGAIDAKVYAKWDSGSVVHVYQNKDNVVTWMKDVRISKNPDSRTDAYVLGPSEIGFYVPEDYVCYGWEADDNVFYEKIEIEGREELVKTNFHKGPIENMVEFTKETTLTCILKKPTTVIYKAVDSDGNKVNFMKELKPDYSMYIGEKYIDCASRTKLNDVFNAKCDDFDKDLLYWEIYDPVTDSFTEVDLMTLVLEAKYSVRKVTTLRAVFG